MNYSQHYELLMARARDRVLYGYSERHHIVPRCIGGTNNKVNIVRLTPEEHYVAHQLLVKIYPGVKSLVWATMVMTGGRKHQPRKNKVYGWLRRKVIAIQTGKTKSAETRAKLAAANKGKKFTPERCANISAGKTGKKRGPQSEQHRANIAIANTGKTPSDETRAKMRAAKLGRKQNPQHVANATKAKIGKKRSLTARANMVVAWERRRARANTQTNNVDCR